ncbi:hypothetical protein PR003_g6381 [Phytophthora rubi]|uniref:Uncharacterized protein n=1 Tax=Phytophthora rubi TaxID=129364 RepID=A0A6A3N829_9STRA|nr:hypothetical protein PR002_g6333 [Phytophthora rubi]KAE9042858.1 hypothetical protein PR001_g6025 [Phytophthora rubi]KAE9348519.1 hypothetical protein PR003_g6381 [Phytophthora rubi]
MSTAHTGAQLSDSTDTGMGVSQIDMSVQLSQRTLDDLFDSESDVELSQAAVPRAFGLSASDLNAEEARLKAETSVHMLSRHLVSRSKPRSHSLLLLFQFLPPTECFVRALKRKWMSILILDDESMCDYESYSSSDSDSEVVTEEEDSPMRDNSEEEEDEITDADAIQMDTAFIEALQIGSASLNK